MKSIKQQYIDLREGNMSQANFMRNLRMTLPQYVTNLSSFEDSVRILKNKGILTEADLSISKDTVDKMKSVLQGLTANNDEYHRDGYTMGFFEGEGQDEKGKEISETDTNSGPNAQWLGSIKDIIEDKWQNGEIKTSAEYGSVMTKLSTQPEGIIAQYGETSAEDAANKLLNSVSHLGSEYEPESGEDEDFERDYDMDYKDPNDPFDMAESLNETVSDDEIMKKYNEMFGKNPQTKFADVAKALNIPEDQVSAALQPGNIPKFGLREAKDEKGKWTNTSGKSMYDQFKEIDNLNGQEVLIGIDFEMEKNHDLTKQEAAKIVIRNLKKIPNYYTNFKLSGKEGYEPGYIGGKSAQPEAHQMQYLDKNRGNVVDKKRGMQPVKGVEKPKKDSDKGGETNKAEKNIKLMSLIAKTVRGMKKMDATGEKMKKIVMKEAQLNDFPGETPGKIAQQIQNYIDSNPTLQKYSDEITLQSNPDGFLRFGYWETLPSDAAKALSLQFNIEPDYIDADEDTSGGTFYRLTPKHTAGKVNLNKADLMRMIREELAEITGVYSGDAMDAEDGSSYTND